MLVETLRKALAWGTDNGLILDPALVDPTNPNSLVARLNRVDQYLSDTALTATQRRSKVTQELNRFVAAVNHKDNPAAFAQSPKGFGVRGIKAPQSYLVYTALNLRAELTKPSAI